MTFDAEGRAAAPDGSTAKVQSASGILRFSGVVDRVTTGQIILIGLIADFNRLAFSPDDVRLTIKWLETETAPVGRDAVTPAADGFSRQSFEIAAPGVPGKYRLIAELRTNVGVIASDRSRTVTVRQS